MQERSFIYAMLHTRPKGQPLSQFREEVKGLSLEDRQWFVEQMAKELDIAVVAAPQALAIIQSLPQPITYVKEYLHYESESGSDADGA